MGFNNPKVPWLELHRRLSDRRPSPVPSDADGGDSPAWSRHRTPYQAPSITQTVTKHVPYVELHCHSNFSFLDGASHPEELVEEAKRLGINALALTDHNGFYGIVRFAEAASAVGLPTIFGTELTLDAGKSVDHAPDPSGTHLVIIARNPHGYARLARTISEAQLQGKKNQPRISLDSIDSNHDDWLVLTGCRKGLVAKTFNEQGIEAAGRALDVLSDRFGKNNLAVELWQHGDAMDSIRNDAMFMLAQQRGLMTVVTNNVHYARPDQARLGNVVAAIRSRSNLDDMRGWLPVTGQAHLRSGAEQALRFIQYPGVMETTYELGMSCVFDLQLIAPRLPDFPVPEGHTEMSWLRELTEQGAHRYYGERNAEKVAGAYKQIDYELNMIDQLGFPGYFLIIWEIVQFCNDSNIYCQGRGSAANSAVCFALGITKADAVKLKLLFERFLAPERDGPPDIDLDIESGRREEVIQHVYERYGRHNAAQVANVITYRPKNAVRDAGRAFGHDPGQLDTWSKHLERWGPVGEAIVRDEIGIPQDVAHTAAALDGFPRHLGIHSGGMVICDRPVVEVCPVEWGRMKDRSVLQWDKDDCAVTGLVKFDLLGLGMLEALHRMVDLLAGYDGTQLDLADLPQDDAVYEMMQRADTVGVFQIESRAQMATLPRLKPREFYDLVVEVALIRPGPIQGGSVHPYIRRRNGQERITYLHPLLENSLKKTLGVPLFQEQLMQMAIDVAGFTATEADVLRQAMGSKRSQEKMERLRRRLYEGMAERGITGPVADEIFEKLAAFANFGFPESHSVSFAYLVYSSAYIKYHYPAAFLAGLLNSQPMGFWSPATLIGDAQRHGVTVLKADVNFSQAQAGIQADGSVRLGLATIRNVSEALAERIAAEQPFENLADFERRIDAPVDVLETLATADAFRSFGANRREALWAAGALSQARPAHLDGIVVGVDAPQLPAMDKLEESVADLWATNVSPDAHLVSFVRSHLNEIGATPANQLPEKRDRSRIVVGGVVTHRQRPATASGITFLSVEDETGLMNIVCNRQVWNRHRKVAIASPAVIIRGRLESAEGVINIVATEIEALPVAYAVRSRDFH
jgi:error-prone DNA polymerase